MDVDSISPQRNDQIDNTILYFVNIGGFYQVDPRIFNMKKLPTIELSGHGKTGKNKTSAFGFTITCHHLVYIVLINYIVLISGIWWVICVNL